MARLIIIRPGALVGIDFDIPNRLSVPGDRKVEGPGFVVIRIMVLDVNYMQRLQGPGDYPVFGIMDQGKLNQPAIMVNDIKAVPALGV